MTIEVADRTIFKSIKWNGECLCVIVSSFFQLSYQIKSHSFFIVSAEFSYKSKKATNECLNDDCSCIWARRTSVFLYNQFHLIKNSIVVFIVEMVPKNNKELPNKRQTTIHVIILNRNKFREKSAVNHLDA